MSNPSGGDRAGAVTVSGFGGLNILRFIDGTLPANIWPARLRISGIADNGRVAAKLHYVDVDGTDPKAISELLAQSTEITLSEIDCEVDIMGLLSELDSLDVIMPNTAILTKNHTMSVRT